MPPSMRSPWRRVALGSIWLALLIFASCRNAVPDDDHEIPLPQPESTVGGAVAANAPVDPADVPVDPASYDPPSEAELTTVRAQVDRLDRSLPRVAHGDDEARLVLAFFRESVVIAVPRPGYFVHVSQQRSDRYRPLTVVFLDRREISELFGTRADAASCLFVPETNTIFIATPLSTEPWLEATILHEALHAFQAMQRGTNGQLERIGELEINVDDEEAAHALTRRLLNLATHGGYERAIADIVSIRRHRMPDDFGIEALTRREREVLDALFPEPSGELERETREFQYLLDVTTDILRVEDEEPRRARTRAYRRLALAALTPD